MNILFLSELFYPHGSGGELATYLWAKGLAESGNNVNVVTSGFLGEPEKSELRNLRIHRLRMFGDQVISSARIKYRIMTRIDVAVSRFIRRLLAWADVVYVPKYWYSVIPVAKAHGVPVIVHMHGYIPPCSIGTLFDVSKNQICNRNVLCNPSCIAAHEMAQGRGVLETLGSSLLNPAIRPYVTKMVELSDAVICVSEAQKNLLLEKLPSLVRKTHVIYNPLPKVPGIADSGKDIGYFGGPSRLKGFDILCKALKYVKRPVTVHMTGFDDDTRRLGRAKINFYKRLPEEDYWRLYNQIGMVVVPSIWAEPWGYVVSEAILQGRLVIASNIGGIPEQTRGCPGTFLFQPQRPEQLAQLIEEAFDLDTRIAVELANRNREVFQKRFDTRESLRRFTDILERVESR